MHTHIVRTHTHTRHWHIHTHTRTHSLFPGQYVHASLILDPFKFFRPFASHRSCVIATSGTALTLEQSSPHCVAKWEVSGFNGRASKRILKFELSLWTPVPVHMSFAPTPSAFGETGQARQGNSVQGSVHCSPSLRTADYNHHKCRALKALFNNVSSFKNLSYMALHAISVCNRVWKWSPDKIVLQKHY